MSQPTIDRIKQLQISLATDFSEDANTLIEQAAADLSLQVTDVYRLLEDAASQEETAG